MEGLHPNPKSKRLFSAVEDCNVHLVSELLRRGGLNSMEINQRDEDGCTVLFKACTEYPLLVNVLLEREDLHVNLTNYMGESPLMQACEGCNLDAVRLLLKRPEIRVNAQNLEDGRTALFYATATAGCVELMQLLLAHPAIDVTLKNSSGMAVLDQTGREEVKPLLRAHLNAQPPHSWLAARLQSSGYDTSTIRHCELRLVSQEGFLNEQDFAECLPGSEFNKEYLSRIGIDGLGLQKYLLKLQAQLHAEVTQQAAGTTIAEP